MLTRIDLTVGGNNRIAQFGSHQFEYHGIEPTTLLIMHDKICLVFKNNVKRNLIAKSFTK